MVAILVLAKSLLFQWRILNIKLLTEKGASPMAALYYQRLALFPSLLLVALTFRKEYLEAILGNRLFLGALIFNFLFWAFQEYLGFYLLKSVQNLGFLSAFSAVVSIPVYTVIGWAVNKDAPSLLVLAALAALIAAILIKPAPNDGPKTRMFEKGLLFAAGIALARFVFDGANLALSRFLFTNLNATLFLVGLFATLASFSVYVVMIFHRPQLPEKAASNKKFLILAYSIPALWFIASIPEGYSLQGAPIFTVLAISSVAFFVDVLSDLKNKRVVWNYRTAIFILLVVAEIGMAALSTA